MVSPATEPQAPTATPIIAHRPVSNMAMLAWFLLSSRMRTQHQFSRAAWESRHAIIDIVDDSIVGPRVDGLAREAIGAKPPEAS
ncbi:MAG: hypothetical protein JNG88_02035 [Phycisphaerales bacterium]|nr:hypothetical protein [Phycisphaerales bacterium]